jgi:hypothetical protein
MVADWPNTCRPGDEHEFVFLEDADIAVLGRRGIGSPGAIGVLVPEALGGDHLVDLDGAVLEGAPLDIPDPRHRFCMIAAALVGGLLRRLRIEGVAGERAALFGLIDLLLDLRIDLPLLICPRVPRIVLVEAEDLPDGPVFLAVMGVGIVFAQISHHVASQIERARLADDLDARLLDDFVEMEDVAALDEVGGGEPMHGGLHQPVDGRGLAGSDALGRGDEYVVFRLVVGGHDVEDGAVFESVNHRYPFWFNQL